MCFAFPPAGEISQCNAPVVVVVATAATVVVIKDVRTDKEEVGEK